MRAGNKIYLDYQATTPVDKRVVSEMVPFLANHVGNPHSSDHSFGWEASKAIDVSTANVAQLIGADPDEIIFTSGATEANNLALIGLGRRALACDRKRILISSIEHKCVLASGRVLNEQLGYKVEIIPVDGNGFIDIKILEEKLDDDVLVVSVMAVNNEIGTIQDIPKLSSLIKKYGAFIHCDAAQAPCAKDLGSMAEYIDLMSLSAHKMYGPMGIGVLYIGRDLQEYIEPLIYGGGQQNNLRSGTLPVALCVGMGTAASLFKTEEARKDREMVRNLRDYLVESLLSLPWNISLNGPGGETDRHPGNANIRFEGFSASDILSTLQPKVAASTGSACASGIQEPSHVLKAIGLSTSEAEASIRFSLGRLTTKSDLEEVVQLISETLSSLERVIGIHSV